MSRQRSFDDILDAALDAIQDGSPLDDVLASYPEYAEQLRPLLDTATQLDAEPAYLAPTARLQANFAAVQRELGRVRPAAAASSGQKPWWQRRITFATLSLPAGVFAFALMSAGGSAAATIVATTGLSSRVSNTVDRVTPSWSHAIIPGGDDRGEHVAPVVTRDPATDPTTAPVSTPFAAPSSVPATVAATAIASAAAVPTAPGPQPIAIAGVVANVRGNVFELTVNGSTYVVQIDANTFVEGTIADGASASVDGELTGNDRVHATRVTIVDAAETTDPPPQSEPGGGANPEQTKTPPGLIDKTKTPPGQLDKTKTPRANPNGNDNN
jgi:hypothetical protein